MELWRRMEQDPLFHHPTETPSLEEQRRICVDQMFRLKQWEVLIAQDIAADVKKVKIII